jgi:hypothetical protein
VQGRRHPVPPEQHNAQKTGFEEKSRQAFIGEHGGDDVGHLLGEDGEIGAELEGQGDTRHHADGKMDGENFHPEAVHAIVKLVPGPQPEKFNRHQEKRQADGQGGEYDVKACG